MYRTRKHNLKQGIIHNVIYFFQDLYILDGDLPKTTTNLIINGGQSLMFDTYSLTQLKDVRHIIISRARRIRMRKYAAQNLNIISIYLKIVECDDVRIEERAFSNIKGTLLHSINSYFALRIEFIYYPFVFHIYVSLFLFFFSVTNKINIKYLLTRV